MRPLRKADPWASPEQGHARIEVCSCRTLGDQQKGKLYHLWELVVEFNSVEYCATSYIATAPARFTEETAPDSPRDVEGHEKGKTLM